MNKISLLGLSAVMAVAFAACDGYEEPNPAPQTNEQESIIDPASVSFTNIPAATDVVNLNTLDTDDKAAKLATVTGVLPEGYSFATKAEFSVNGEDWYSFPTEVVADTEVENTWTVTADADDFGAAYREHVTKDPTEVVVKVRYKLYTVTGNMAGLVRTTDGADWRNAEFHLMPLGYAYVMQDAYYFIQEGRPFSEAVKLTRDLEKGENLYDNPVFSGIVELTGATKWAIIPQTTLDNGSIPAGAYAAWGPAEATAEEGKLAAQTADSAVKYGDFAAQAASYKVTVDMLNGTFKFEMALANIYCIGSHCKNKPADATVMQTQNYSDYYAFINLGNSFRFISQPVGQPDMKWGAPEEPGTPDAMKLGSGTAFHPEKQGFSYVVANIVKLTYKVVPVTTFGLIGDATPGGWDDDTPMTVSAASPYIWEADVTFKGEGSFKFRANGGWDVNLGGEAGNLTFDGSNLPTPGAGDYHVRLDLTAVPYTVTLTAK